MSILMCAATKFKEAKFVSESLKINKYFLKLKHNKSKNKKKYFEVAINNSTKIKAGYSINAHSRFYLKKKKKAYHLPHERCSVSR